MKEMTTAVWPTNHFAFASTGQHRGSFPCTTELLTLCIHCNRLHLSFHSRSWLLSFGFHYRRPWNSSWYSWNQNRQNQLPNLIHFILLLFWTHNSKIFILWILLERPTYQSICSVLRQQRRRKYNQKIVTIERTPARCTRSTKRHANTCKNIAFNWEK